MQPVSPGNVAGTNPRSFHLTSAGVTSISGHVYQDGAAWEEAAWLINFKCA